MGGCENFHKCFSSLVVRGSSEVHKVRGSNREGVVPSLSHPCAFSDA